MNMKFTLSISEVKSSSEIPGYWKNEDYINILEDLNFPDAKNAKPSELQELLEMAINDFEPHESAEILLKYKLKDQLNSGQIRNLSHELSDENTTDVNSDIGLHYALFNINQLLFQAYKKIFHSGLATIVDFELSFKDEPKISMTKELVLRAISHALVDKNPLLRLFEDQLNGKEPFGDTEKTVWDLRHNGANKYTLITSDYWINQDDFKEMEVSGSFKLFEEKED